MGADDRNEGDNPGECIEHAWVTVQGIAARDGGYVEQECARCGALLVLGPRELGGWV